MLGWPRTRAACNAASDQAGEMCMKMLMPVCWENLFVCQQAKQRFSGRPTDGDALLAHAFDGSRRPSVGQAIEFA